MQTKPKHTVVEIPHEKKLHVSYYCTDRVLNGSGSNLNGHSTLNGHNKLNGHNQLNGHSKLNGAHEEYAELVIQLDDCHQSIKIPKSKLDEPEKVEAIVQRTVINARGHLCDE